MPMYTANITIVISGPMWHWHTIKLKIVLRSKNHYTECSYRVYNVNIAKLQTLLRNPLLSRRPWRGGYKNTIWQVWPVFIIR